MCIAWLMVAVELHNYYKRQKFGGTLVWRIWRIKEVHQTLICQLATFILFIIGCTVNSPNFLQPTCFERQFAKLKSCQTFVFYGTIDTNSENMCTQQCLIVQLTARWHQVNLSSSHMEDNHNIGNSQLLHNHRCTKL